MEVLRIPRIAIYSQDGLGLGHLRRTSTIAKALLQLRPDACVFALADSPAGEFFKTSPHHDYLKLPSIVKVGPGAWGGVRLPLPFADIHALRQELIRSAMINFQPDLLLVDHMPHGAMGELLPALHALKAARPNTNVVLGLRDILDAPPLVQDRWQREGAYDAIERFYDKVLVYGSPDVFDLPQQYHFPDSIANRMQYCGYVCAPDVVQHADRTRAKFLAGAPTARLVAAMAGGGADAYPMMRALLDAMPTIQAQTPCVLVMITGPFMPPPQARDLRARARGLPVRVLRSVDDVPRLIEAADLVVAMAGYNTSVEILRSGKPAILVPRSGPSAEQRMRAQLFAARGWVRLIEPEAMTIDCMTHTVVDQLVQPQAVAVGNRPNLQGLRVAVDQLIAMLPPPSIEPATRVPVPLQPLKQPAPLIGTAT